MEKHPIALLIDKADAAINQEDFDTLIDVYADDAVLVIHPGVNAVGKEEIRKAFISIAAHFEHSLEVRQDGMEILETKDTALVLAKTIISAKGGPVIERKATYVFKKTPDNHWVCSIDNSYGHDLLEVNS
ncbi:MAG: SgcJ/EcaC family oxidoreductase [Gammaproteobacteria bacterium]|nr:SgcJ/EcaC family oxidoreductase [Gammaproteobacteria bacterium]